MAQLYSIDWTTDPAYPAIIRDEDAWYPDGLTLTEAKRQILAGLQSRIDQIRSTKDYIRSLRASDIKGRSEE